MKEIKCSKVEVTYTDKTKRSYENVIAFWADNALQLRNFSETIGHIIPACNVIDIKLEVK